MKEGNKVVAKISTIRGDISVFATVVSVKGVYVTITSDKGKSYKIHESNIISIIAE